MARTFMHELADWPDFDWDAATLAPLLSEVRLRQGLLLGKMGESESSSRWIATLRVLTEETIKSSAIEGVALDPERVRSSLAHRLGLWASGAKARKDRDADGAVEMMFDATRRFNEPLTKRRLFGWHENLFPRVSAGAGKFRIGAWRDDPVKAGCKSFQGRLAGAKFTMWRPPPRASRSR